MGAPQVIKWTIEREAKFRKLHAQGYSFSDIAAQLGFPGERNACIGKAHRLGLGERPQSTKDRSKTRPKVKRLTNHGNRFDHVEINAPALLPILSDGSDTPAAQRCTLLQLNSGVCKWPFGEPASPDFFFCGGDAIEGKPYCAEHCRLAHKTSWA
jgi:GcrA cell cycle regulator